MPGNFMATLAQLVHLVVHIYIFIIIIRAVMSWMGPVPHHPLVLLLKKITDPVFNFVHRHIPFSIMGGIDLSPIIIILALTLLENLIIGILLGGHGGGPTLGR